MMAALLPIPFDGEAYKFRDKCPETDLTNLSSTWGTPHHEPRNATEEETGELACNNSNFSGE
jgi:hypothetical protein